MMRWLVLCFAEDLGRETTAANASGEGAGPLFGCPPVVKALPSAASMPAAGCAWLPLAAKQAFGHRYHWASLSLLVCVLSPLLSAHTSHNTNKNFTDTFGQPV